MAHPEITSRRTFCLTSRLLTTLMIIMPYLRCPCGTCTCDMAKIQSSLCPQLVILVIIQNTLSFPLSLFNLHPFKVVSRYLDPQLPVGEHIFA